MLGQDGWLKRADSSICQMSMEKMDSECPKIVTPPKLNSGGPRAMILKGQKKIQLNSQDNYDLLMINLIFAITERCNTRFKMKRLTEGVHQTVANAAYSGRLHFWELYTVVYCVKHAHYLLGVNDKVGESSR